MRVAFLGTHGIPASYGGFETFVEQLSVRLVRRGHDVTVYNRIPYQKYRGREYQGVRLVSLPTIPTKGTDTIVHTALSVLHSVGRRYDVVYFCGVGNSLLSFVPRMRRMKTVVNVDGADFERAKWGRVGRWWLHRSERWAARLADVVIADNGAIERRYREEYGTQTELIPYGANVVTDDPGSEWLQKLGLLDDNYLLYVSRLTPENAAHLTIEAYLASGVTMPLVIVGGATYQNEYISQLKAMAARSDRIHLTGFVFGDGYRQLSFHARAFILPTSIEATRPVLLEQMGFGNCVVVRDTPGNLEVIGGAGMTFRHADPVDSLAAALKLAAEDGDLAREFGRKAQQRIGAVYDWEVLTDRYEELFLRMLA